MELKSRNNEDINNLLMKQTFDDIKELLNYMDTLLINEDKEVRVEWDNLTLNIDNNIRIFLINNNYMA